MIHSCCFNRRMGWTVWCLPAVRLITCISSDGNFLTPYLRDDVPMVNRIHAAWTYKCSVFFAARLRIFGYVWMLVSSAIAVWLGLPTYINTYLYSRIETFRRKFIYGSVTLLQWCHAMRPWKRKGGKIVNKTKVDSRDGGNHFDNQLKSNSYAPKIAPPPSLIGAVWRRLCFRCSSVRCKLRSRALSVIRLVTNLGQRQYRLDGLQLVANEWSYPQ